MKVFFCWLGELSKNLANEVKNFLDRIFTRGFDVFYSPDIEKGVQWDQKLTEALQHCSIGIICVTRDNSESRYMNFEAGALSIRFDKSKVIPIAFNLKPNDISQPLSKFQASEFSEGEMWALVNSVNASYESDLIKPDVLRETFDIR